MDYVVIMGGGRVGLALANLLIDEGYDITLIENDNKLCAEVASELDALVVCGNGTNSKILEEVNIEDAMLCDQLFDILMGDKVEPRRDFIQQHAVYATNIDA